MRESSSNQMADPGSDDIADPSVSHLPLLHRMVYLTAHQMAEPSANDEPINNQMVGPSTYFRPLNYQMDRFSSYYIPLNYQIQDPGTYYGPLNYQMQDASTYYNPLTYQMAGQNAYYGPMNYQHACPYSHYGTLNDHYARHSFDHNSHPSLLAHNQNLSNQLPLSDIPTATALTEPSASPQLNGNASVCMPPKCVGLPNDEMVQKLEGSPAVAAAPTQTTTTATSQSNSTNQRSKTEDQLHSERPYIKKPSNAFMLFMRELRPKVMAQCKITNNASVNVILGQRWKSMSWEEKAPYYKQACEEKQLHFQQHPDWSHMNNYGKKRKRVRGKAATRAKAAAVDHEEEPPQVDKRSLASAQAGVTEAQLRPTHSVVMQAVYENSNVVMATKAASCARDSSDSDCESTGSLAPIEDILDVVNVKLPSCPAQTQNALPEFQRVSEVALSASLAPPTPAVTLPHFVRDSSNSDCESAGSLAPIEDILGLLNVELPVQQQ